MIKAEKAREKALVAMHRERFDELLGDIEKQIIAACEKGEDHLTLWVPNVFADSLMEKLESYGYCSYTTSKTREYLSIKGRIQRMLYISWIPFADTGTCNMDIPVSSVIDYL